LSTIDGRLNHSVEDAIRLANDYILKIDEKKSEVGHTETLYTFKDGFTIKKLLDQKELNREGNLMGHCTKDERQGYFNKIKSKEIELWSLRDTSNDPHCTIEYVIKEKRVLQIKGKQNGGVVEKYIPYVKEFLQDLSKKKLILNFDSDDLLNIGILEQDGQWYDILCLPENFTVKGSLDLRNVQIEKLPKGLTVSGYLDLSGTKIKELPEGLTVGRNLYLDSSLIEVLPKRLHVVGSLSLSYTKIKELPEGLIVGGDLDVSNTQIKELPKGLTVKGGLDLMNTPIECLPEGLKVGGSLYLDDSALIEILPEGLKVGGDLTLRNTKIKELPKGLKVKGDLELSGTQIKELPEGLKVAGFIDIRNTQIKTIKRSLLKNVKGDIYKDATTQIVD
jgi:hypothetical protein